MYVEKGKIPVKIIEFIKSNNLDIKIKELDITTKEILEMYKIDEFPSLVYWSVNKRKLATGEKEIMNYLKEHL